MEEIRFADLVFTDNDDVVAKFYVEISEVTKVLDLYMGYSHRNPPTAAIGRKSDLDTLRTPFPRYP